MNYESAIRVLVVDDHPIFRAGLIDRLGGKTQEITVIGEASNGLQACELTGTLHPQLILMNCDMPIMNGLEATQKIKADFPEVKIVILCSTAEVEKVKAVLRAGADGYLLKTVELEELREAVISVMHGSPVIASEVAYSLLSEANHIPANSAGLTKKEIQILELVSQGATNKSIAKDLDLSSRTIEVHLHNIFAELGASSRTEAVTKAIRDQSIELP